MAEEKEKFGRDYFIVKEHKNKPVHLFGKVPRFAIDKIKQELDHLNENKNGADQDETCNCAIRWNYKLPCRHVIPATGPIPLSLFPSRWLLCPSDHTGLLFSIKIIYVLSTDNENI